MKDLADKVAFVTGAASGIGLGICRAAVDAGMKVMMADIEAPVLEQVHDFLPIVFSRMLMWRRSSAMFPIETQLKTLRKPP